MNNLLINIHNFIHNTVSNIDSWIVAKPKQAIWVAIFIAGVIIGAILF
jgi:hypothetical protein